MSWLIDIRWDWEFETLRTSRINWLALASMPWPVETWWRMGYSLLSRSEQWQVRFEWPYESASGPCQDAIGNDEIKTNHIGKVKESKSLSKICWSFPSWICIMADVLNYDMSTFRTTKLLWSMVWTQIRLCLVEIPFQQRNCIKNIMWALGTIKWLPLRLLWRRTT